MDSYSNSINWLWTYRIKSSALQYILFFIGIGLWFAVGYLWKDRAIMVVHVGAFISLLIGYLSA
jgi:hypothetical protein